MGRGEAAGGQAGRGGAVGCGGAPVKPAQQAGSPLLPRKAGCVHNYPVEAACAGVPSRGLLSCHRPWRLRPRPHRAGRAVAPRSHWREAGSHPAMRHSAQAPKIRAEFEAMKNLDEPGQIERALEKGEAKLRSFLHPDPYIGAQSSVEYPVLAGCLGMMLGPADWPGWLCSLLCPGPNIGGLPTFLHTCASGWQAGLQSCCALLRCHYHSHLAGNLMSCLALTCALVCAYPHMQCPTGQAAACMLATRPSRRRRVPGVPGLAAHGKSAPRTSMQRAG